MLILLSLGTGIPIKAASDHKEEARDIINGIILYSTGYEGTPLKELEPKDKNNVLAQETDKFIREIIPEKIGATAEWYVLGLSQYGDYDFYVYRDALTKYLSEKKIGGASGRLKFALILSIVTGGKQEADTPDGNGDVDFIHETLNDDSIGGQGIMSYVFGLHLLNNGYSGNVSKEDIVAFFGRAQHEDGGWSIMGEYGDVDVTAMVLQSLAPLSEKNGNEDPGLAELASQIDGLIDRGLNFLSEKQEDDGVFSSLGVRNAESTAQVITALSALGIDCAGDARFIKNGNSPLDAIQCFKLTDGSFSHKEDDASNPSATVQTFYSMVAYLRMCEGLSPLYVQDKNEVKLATLYNENTDQKDTVENNKDTGNTQVNIDKKEKQEINKNQNTDEKQNLDGSSTDAEKEYATETNAVKDSGYKVYAIIGIAVFCACLCLVFFIKKKHWKNYLFAGCLGIAGILIVLFTDFSSPENYYGKTANKTDVIGTVTMSIRCDILKGKELNEHIPKDYCILDTTEFDVEEGETAYDILVEGAKKYSINIDHKGSSEIVYISGINYLYENDFGDLSGWVYKVNGVLPSVGCGGYKLEPGDRIEWCYTLDLGNDVAFDTKNDKKE